MNRIRSKDTSSGPISAFSGSLPFTRYRPPAAPLTGNASVSYLAASKVVGWEYMVDEIGPSLRDRPCLHKKHSREFYPTPYVHSGSNELGSWTVYPNTNFGISRAFQQLGGCHSLDGNGRAEGIIPTWYAGSDEQVVQSLYTQARKPYVEGLVNALEAHQLPSALEDLSRNFVKDDIVFRRFGLFKKALKLASKRISSAYLAYQFGIAPLVRDVAKVAKGADALAKFNDRFAAGDNFHVSRVFTGHLEGTPTTYAPAYSETEVVSSLGDYDSPETRYTLTFRYKRLFNNSTLSGLQASLQRYGFLNPAETIWEIIPWSFVVDWFIDMTGLLQRVDDFLGFDPIETISCCKSRKTSYGIDYTKVVFGHSTGIPVSSVASARSSYSFYERVPLGRSTYVGPSNRFGKKQLLLSAALARVRYKSLARGFASLRKAL